MTAHLAIGIGCRRGTSAADIGHAVRMVLEPYDMSDVECIASIDTKRDEHGLIEFCTLHGLPLRFYGAEEIARVPLDAPSPHALRHLKVDGVCEPCALLASGNGRLVIAKTILGGVTVAIAQRSLNSQHEDR